MDQDPLLKRLDELEKGQKMTIALLLEIRHAVTVREDLDSLIDPLDLSKKLHISERSLRRLKKAGVLVPCTLGSRDFYLESHVIQALKDSRIRRK